MDTGRGKGQAMESPGTGAQRGQREKAWVKIQKEQKVKRSKVTFDLLQYEQMEDDIPKGLMSDAIINNKPLYNVRAHIIIIYRIFYHHKLHSLTEDLADYLSSRLPLKKGKSQKSLLTF